MLNSEDFYEKLLEGWERRETNVGIPYYINHKTERTQWDHPFMVKTLEELRDFDNIRYAAYRTAMKLRFIQKRLQFDLVDLQTITSVFDRNNYPGAKDTVIDCRQLYDILVDIYKYSHKTPPDLNAELLLNWILNLYDINREGCIRVQAVKTGLIAICSSRLSEKYSFFFRQVCDHTNNIDRMKLGTFLNDIMQLPEFLMEGVSFGGLNISPAVESCFQVAWSTAHTSEDAFMEWLLKEPQTLVWLPTLHRLSAAESVKHESKCNICKALPIIGFRYKCLKCFNYDICQQCFFTGRVSKNHKLKHPTQEYCLATTTKEDTKAFMKTVRNNLSKKHRNKKKLRYLPVTGSDTYYSSNDLKKNNAEGYDEVEAPEYQHSQDDEEETDEERYVTSPVIEKEVERPVMALEPYTPVPQEFSTPHSHNDQRELESIIHHLEDENKELMKLIKVQKRREDNQDSDSGSENEWYQEEQEIMEAKQEVIESHNRQLELQLIRLRQLVKNDARPKRHPLSELSQNVPTKTPFMYQVSPLKPPPYQQPPTPYNDEHLMPKRNNHATPRNLFLSPKQTNLKNTPNTHMNSTPRGERSLHHSLDPLEIDITYGSMDPTLGGTRYSLPDQSRNFPHQEADLNDLIDRIEQAFPEDMSHEENLANESALEEMFKAANKIGDAMSGFVGTTGKNGEDVRQGCEGAVGYQRTPEQQRYLELLQQSLAGTSSA